MGANAAISLRFILSLGIVWLAGCAKVPVPYSYPPVADALPLPPAPVIRQSRYTLVELRPDLAQQDLQQQIIDLRIPATTTTKVGEAMRYVLQGSGYRLCADDPPLSTVFALPLPAAHWKLGPLPLNQTLQMLAGDTWRLTVNERERQVCFIAEGTTP